MGKLARLIVQPQDVLYDLLGIFQPKVGKWYSSIITWRGRYTRSDMPANELQAHYYPIFRKIRFDEIGMDVLGAGASGARFRLGVYDDKDLYPNKLLVDSGELNAETTGVKTASIDLTLSPGVYWLAYIANDSTIDTPYADSLLARYALQASDNLFMGWVKGITYGALPDPFPSGAYNTSWGVPLSRLRVRETY